MVLVASGLVAFTTAAPALAAGQRFASPTGSSSAPCTAASPCDIVTAINGDGAMNNPSSGDEVIVEPGTYGSPTPLTTTLNPPVDLSIHGVAGRPRPLIEDNATGAAMIVSGSSTVAYLDLESGVGAAFFANGGAMLDRVIAHTSARYACETGTALITNSVCWSSAPAGIGLLSYCAQLGAPSQAHAANVDAYATGVNGTGIEVEAVNSACQISLTATNVIARGTNTDAVADTGAANNVATLTLDHSDYVSADIQGPGIGASVTTPGTGTNIAGDPMLAGPAAGDFHETSASPTIDLGASDPAHGYFDFEGQPRVEGGATDIGADEFIVSPVVTAATVTRIGRHGARLNGTINPGHDTTSYVFHYGTTLAMKWRSSTQTLAPGRSARAVSAPIGGLPAGRRIYWRLAAHNAAGSAVTSPQHFATAPPPKPPRLTHLSQSHRRWREGRRLARISRARRPIGTSFTFRLDKAATVRLAFTQSLPGRRVGGHCVTRTPHNRHAHACQRIATRGSLRFAAHAGINTVHFEGRLSAARRLRPGQYKLMARASALGVSSSSRALVFTIVA